MRLSLGVTVACLGAGLLLLAGTLQGQRRSTAAADAVTRATIDSFVITVRDMAAWALVTPAAHVPVGALQNAKGNVESVVGSQNGTTLLTSDSVLVAFRQALGIGARARGAQAIGLAYFRNVVPPGGSAPASVLVVEVEYRSGYRATLLFPFDQSGETPEFLAPFAQPAQLHEFVGRAQRKSGATRQRPRSDDDSR